MQLTYVDELLAALKALFVKLYQPFLSNFVASLSASSSSSLKASSTGSETALSWDFARVFEKWDSVFDDLLKKIEAKAAQVLYIVTMPVNAIMNVTVTFRIASPASSTLRYLRIHPWS